MSPPNTSSHHLQQKGGGGTNSSFKVLFDPSKPDVVLFDKDAEEQADKLTINSNQLRKYFGEIKDLYRQFEARSAGRTEQANQIYMEAIEARFKMIRSKVAYGQRASGNAKVPKEFADFLSIGIGRVGRGNSEHFTKFVMHLEAVVGFMYGKDRVQK